MKRIIHIALVQSFFSYGLMFWCCAYNTHIEKLKVTINSIITFLSSRPKFYSTISLLLMSLMCNILITYFLMVYYYYHINISIFIDQYES